MTEIITAVYENGLLRPLQPLPFREQQMLRLQVLSESELELLKPVWQELIEAGSLTPPPGRSTVEPVSEAERHRLADTLGQVLTSPLSEIIIEDRGKW